MKWIKTPHGLVNMDHIIHIYAVIGLTIMNKLHEEVKLMGTDLNGNEYLLYERHLKEGEKGKNLDSVYDDFFKNFLCEKE